MRDAQRAPNFPSRRVSGAGRCPDPKCPGDRRQTENACGANELSSIDSLRHEGVDKIILQLPRLATKTLDHSTVLVGHFGSFLA